MTSERPDLLTQELPFTVRTTLSAGGTLDELVISIDPPGSKEAYPFQDHGLLRTAYVSPKTGRWAKGWRWPDDDGVNLVPENPMLGAWYAHILINGETPLEEETV